MLTPQWWNREDLSTSVAPNPLSIKASVFNENERRTQGEILEVARSQHMNTDVKRAVFQAIVGSEDYLQAFEAVTRLSLRKQQEREIIKVLVHCCLNEKRAFNKFYGLLAQRLCKYNP